MRRSLVVPAVGLALVGTLVRLGDAGGQPWLPSRAPAEPAPGAPAQPAPGAAAGPAAALYPVTPEAGAWLICAASYMGPDAPELARQVVLELRNRHHLPAFVFNHADEERRRMREEFERIRQLQPDVPRARRTVRLEEQCAVLVGGYADFEGASAALKDVKALPTPELKLTGDRLPCEMVSEYKPDPETKQMMVRRVPVNPFQNAFVIRNPSVPKPAREAPKADPFWWKLNADEDYSLLSCPKAYTLVVKEYTGTCVLQPSSGKSNFLNLLGMGGDKPGE